jgi:nitrogen fixation NifU-like protein
MIDNSDLRELYQEFILDHGKRPRNRRALASANRSGEGYNPLCGDRIHLMVQVDDAGVIRDIGFQGQGCAISTAAASTMTEAVLGKTVDEAKELFGRFHRLVTGGEPDEDALGKLTAFRGVAEFPMRVKCATLAWHTLQAALEGRGDGVSTE